MTRITLADILAGRRRLKALGEDCRARAENLRTSAPEAADHLRDLLRFHDGLKARHLEAAVIVRDSEKWVSILVLSGVPRGMPNLIMAPLTADTEEGAIEHMRGMLDAAWVRILDHKAAMAAGTVEDVRLFEAGPLSLLVPGEILNVIANRIPPKTPEARLIAIREAAIAEMRKLTGDLSLDGEGFTALDDAAQVAIMVEASKALCTGCNHIA